MPNIYSDIKRYDLDPAFLSAMAKQAIADLGWVTQWETETGVVADVPKVNGYAASVIRLKVCYGYVTLSCEMDDLPIGNMDNTVIVDRFLKAFDRQIVQAPMEQRRSLKETYCLKFREAGKKL